MNDSFDFDKPEHFTVGTVGPVGQRVFYLQAAEGSRLCSLRLEKQQVAALAAYLAGLLADLPPAEANASTALGLREPIQPAWTVGSLAVAYEAADDRILILAEELVTESETDELIDPPATARFRLTRAQVAAFVPHAEQLVAAGRPLCALCGHPMNPEGHRCIRNNGHGTR
ncbi:MAG: DUF3090 family protein [Acidimicrobiales bacterium]|nr:DUF3090 family protein [Acidimicrobiales bacterium]